MTINLDQYPRLYNKVDIDTGYLNNDYNFDYKNKLLENVSNKIRNNVIITPPLYPTTLSSACIKNGYLYPMSLQDEPYPKCKTLDNFYYPTQQINKIISDNNDNDDDENDNDNDDDNNNDDNDNNDNNNDNNYKKDDKKKDDKKDKKKDDKKKDDIKDRKNNNRLLDNTPNRRSYYDLEPRFNNVIFPWRAYTWTNPIQPNTETYYRDNTYSLSPTPAYIPNLNLREGTSGVKIPKLEKFKNISKNTNLDQITIIIVIILILFLFKMCKLI
jgi:hypothetical protein